ncbi:MAG: hypothetical protein IPJ32_04695 [Sphingobacteriaceae bacterium]|nr:hypothetical protein [Sphingobacteriaceae bacterium]
MSQSQMEKQELIFREDILIRLFNMFQEDYRASIMEFPQDKKIEFIRYLSECFDIIESPTAENWKIFTKKKVRLKKNMASD